MKVPNLHLFPSVEIPGFIDQGQSRWFEAKYVPKKGAEVISMELNYCNMLCSYSLGALGRHSSHIRFAVSSRRQSSERLNVGTRRMYSGLHFISNHYMYSMAAWLLMSPDVSAGGQYG